MKHNFELINDFTANSQQRIDLFWNTVQGGVSGFKNESILIFLAILPMMPLFLGFAILVERIKHNYPLYFIGMERFSVTLPSTFSVVLNAALWITYLLLSIAIFFPCYKYVSLKSDVLINKNTSKLSESFSPSETVIFSSLRIAKELDIYANAKVPSDFGLGGDLDWIEGCFYKILSGKRPTGSYSGPSVKTNSFFSDLSSEKDIDDRLDLKSWYAKERIHNDEIYSKISKLRDYIYKYGFWQDYSMGVEVYKVIAQTFLAAHLKQENNFKENLNYTLELYEKYSSTKSPLKGIPHFTVWFTPKIFLFTVAIIVLLVISILVFFVPGWIVLIARSRMHINLELATVKEIFQIFFTILCAALPIIILIWKK